MQMVDPRERGDFSRFLVHLTRKTLKIEAEDNLINILKTRKLEARHYHCLFSPKLKKMELTKTLKNAFKTVCFTETPLDQIHKMTSENYPRRIKLKPYGLAFWRHQLIEKGANPAVYLNADGTTLQEYLISEFDKIFRNVKALVALKKREEYYKEIVHYYSLINKMSKDYDYSWEREWRFHGDFEFEFSNIVAIIADIPSALEEKCEKELSKRDCEKVRRIPIISPRWNYEEVIEELSLKLWKMRT